VAGDLRELEPVVRWKVGDKTGRIFKLLSSRAKKATVLAFVRNFCVWKKPGNESGEFLRGAEAAQCHPRMLSATAD
jgi:hypothetical protein